MRILQVKAVSQARHQRRNGGSPDDLWPACVNGVPLFISVDRRQGNASRCMVASYTTHSHPSHMCVIPPDNCPRNAVRKFPIEILLHSKGAGELLSQR